MLMFHDVLLVMALREENDSERLNDFGDILYTGVGKINATLHLAEALLQRDRRNLLVLNLGSAGSHVLDAGQVVAVNRFFERDMDATALGCLPGQTPYEEHVYLETGLSLPGMPGKTCSTGDRFLAVTDPDEVYEVIDMEAYALAKTSHHFGVPFACLKFITDGADGQAAADWRSSLALATEALAETLARLAPQLWKNEGLK